jgi:hypothetical protein
VALSEWGAIADSSIGSANQEHLSISRSRHTMWTAPTMPSSVRLKMIGAIVVSRQLYLKRIDLDGTQRFEDVLDEVKKQKYRY